jgi:mRNA-degrading endonuclease toxin of MazEF toxin-antitoxin module
MIKRFLEWIRIKERLEPHSSRRVNFKEREVWWSAVGENVGVEINGKGKMFSRPVLVYKKINNGSFLSIPLSTQIKEGSWYVPFLLRGRVVCANLAQIRVISTARLYDKAGDVTTRDFEKVKSGFLRLYS